MAKTIQKIILLLCAVAAFAAVVGFLIYQERSECMGIKLLKEKDLRLSNGVE